MTTALRKLLNIAKDWLYLVRCLVSRFKYPSGSYRTSPYRRERRTLSPGKTSLHCEQIGFYRWFEQASAFRIQSYPSGYPCVMDIAKEVCLLSGYIGVTGWCNMKWNLTISEICWHNISVYAKSFDSLFFVAQREKHTISYCFQLIGVSQCLQFHRF